MSRACVLTHATRTHTCLARACLQDNAQAAAEVAAEAAALLAGPSGFGSASDVAGGSSGGDGGSGGSAGSARRPHTVADFNRAYASGQTTPSEVAERVIKAVADSETQVTP